MKKIDGYGHGDHYLTFKITVPKHLTKKQKALLQAYAELETDTPGQIMGITRRTDGKSPFLYCLCKGSICLSKKKSALIVF